MIQFDNETRQFAANQFLKNTGNFLRRHGAAGIVGGTVVGAKRALVGTHGTGYGASMAAGALIGGVKNKMDRAKYEQQLIAQGKDPQEARRLAKQRYGTTAGKVIKGAGIGAGVRFAGKRIASGARSIVTGLK